MEDDLKRANGQKSDWTVGIYYLFLLLIALSWTNKDLVEPNKILRYTFLLCFILPFFKYPNLAPSLINIFLAIRLFSVAPYGYLPSKIDIYFKIILSIYIFHLFYGLQKSKTNYILVFLLIFTLFSNLLNNVAGKSEYNFVRFIIITIISTKLIRNSNDIRLMEWGFVIISLCLSIYGLIFYKDFMVNAIDLQDQERIYWNDPNYLGSIIAIGMVISFYYLLTISYNNFIYKIFCLATIVLGFINLGMFASRGAFLALSLAILFILYKRTYSFRNVILAIIILGIIAYSFMALPVFRTLINRFGDETILNGSGRITIWKESFEFFLNSKLLTIIIGGGGTFSYKISGTAIGSLSISSPHNNYLEILYDYGIVGLTLFIILIINLIKINNKNVLGFSLTLLLIVSSLTLSPLMYPPFWFLITLLENQRLSLSET